VLSLIMRRTFRIIGKRCRSVERKSRRWPRHDALERPPSTPPVKDGAERVQNPSFTSGSGIGNTKAAAMHFHRLKKRRQGPARSRTDIV
jgi:hypothetical protein